MVQLQLLWAGSILTLSFLLFLLLIVIFTAGLFFVRLNPERGFLSVAHKVACVCGLITAIYGIAFIAWHAKERYAEIKQDNFYPRYCSGESCDWVLRKVRL